MSGWQIPTAHELAAWAGAVAAAAYGAFKIWRAKSTTTLANTKDDVEGAGLKFVMAGYEAQIRGLVTERDAAKKESDEAWTQRMLDAATISGLQAENAQLRAQMQTLQQQVDHLQRVVARYLPPDTTNPLTTRAAP